ncbi:MAG: glycosyltransferase [Chloroflexi bacterium]|nr:glycosyltransferase [Chloroflexota bacterium]
MPPRLTTAPVRVVRVITRLNIGGPAIHAILLTEALNDATFRSTLVSGSTALHEGDFANLAAAHGVVPLMLPELGRELNPADDALAFAKLVRVLRRIRPHIVHTHMAKAGTIGRLAARLCRVPIIIHTYHGHVFHGYFGPRKTQLFLTIERALGSFTDRVVVVGERQRQEIASYGVAPREKLEPIPLGLELEPFLGAERYRGELRRELGFGPEVPLVGIVARLVPIKAHEVFLEGARSLRQARPDVRFLIVGDGERRAELERLVDSLDLRAAVTFLSWRQDLARLYADLDVVALTSRNEGSPVVMIEALAAERPVVSTAVGGVAEVVVDGQTGLTIAPNRPDQLAAAVLRLLDDPALAQRLAAAGRRHVYPRFDRQRLIQDVRQLYLSRLAAHGRLLPDQAASVPVASGVSS